VRGTCLGDDLVELDGVPDGTNDELDDTEVEVFAALVTEPAGEAPYPYIVNEEALDLLEPCLLPRKPGGDTFKGECKDGDLMFRHSISKIGGDNESF